jgi:hypothetical protein
MASGMRSSLACIASRTPSYFQRLRPGYRGGWKWTRDGEQVASLQLRRDTNTLVLSYRIRPHGGEWQDVEQPTPIVWMPCRFGGGRPYFVCPSIVNGIVCRRWVTKLYGAGRYFLCRHCYQLAYASQRDDRYDRALRRANTERRDHEREAGDVAARPRARAERQGAPVVRISSGRELCVTMSMMSGIRAQMGPNLRNYTANALSPRRAAVPHSSRILTRRASKKISG